MNPSVEEKIEAQLAFVRPRLAMHKGDVSFVAFNADTGEVQVDMTGTCKGCPLADMTLTHGIEALLVSEIDEVQSVIAVNNEA